MTDGADNLPPLEPKSADLTELVEFARSDLPSDEQWAALTAQMAPLWSGEWPGGSEQQDAPISHVSPASKAGGAEAATQASVYVPVVAKVAGVAALAGALASGVWFAAKAPHQPSSADQASSHQAPTAPVTPSEPVIEAPMYTASSLPSAPPPARVQLQSPVASPRTAPKSTVPTELDLLTRARNQLAHNPEQSLVLCRQHQRMYPQGQLAQEREVLLIEALTLLRRDKEAGQRRVQFGKSFPHSPHQSRVKQGSDEQ